jgi:O-antigen ligase
MPFDLKSATSGMLARLDNWALNVFCLSTLFIVIFSTQAINSWPPLIKSISILMVCVLPAGIVIFVRGPNWLSAKKIPKEILWVLLIFVFGLISALVADNQWSALKSMLLFVVSGPLVFLVTLYLFESTRNQDVFLWMASLGMLGLGFFGIYEHNFNNLEVGYDGILLFSENPLPAGTLLILLLASPMILLSRERSKGLKTVLSLGLMISIVLIILLAKKGPLLGLVVVLLLLVLMNNRRCLKFILGFVFLVGFLIQLSGPTFIKYKSVITSKASVSVRFENYFFGLHMFKENPVWGIGFKGNVTQYLDDYEVKFDHNFSYIDYKQYVLIYQAYENIILTFMVELGGLFSMVYFGGIIYLVVISFKKLRAPPQKDLVGMFIISVLVGFAVVSCTFDTLRYPQLNWLFHSLLGLLVNVSSKQAKNNFEIS